MSVELLCGKTGKIDELHLLLKVIYLTHYYLNFHLQKICLLWLMRWAHLRS